MRMNAAKINDTTNDTVMVRIHFFVHFTSATDLQILL